MPLNRSTTPSRDEIAANVRAELARRGRTRAELAVALGLSRHTVIRRLTGRLPFSTDELAAAARFLDVQLDTLLVPAPVTVADRSSVAAA